MNNQQLDLKTYCPNSPYGYSIHDIMYKVVSEEEIISGIEKPYPTAKTVKQLNKAIKEATVPVPMNFNRPLSKEIQAFNAKYKQSYKKPKVDLLQALTNFLNV